MNLIYFLNGIIINIALFGKKLGDFWGISIESTLIQDYYIKIFYWLVSEDGE